MEAIPPLGTSIVERVYSKKKEPNVWTLCAAEIQTEPKHKVAGLPGLRLSNSGAGEEQACRLLGR